MQQEYEMYKEEMADVTETVEMATLDKEMAEEKVPACVSLLAYLPVCLSACMPVILPG